MTSHMDIRAYAFQNGPDMLRREIHPPGQTPVVWFKRAAGAPLLRLPPMPRTLGPWENPSTPVEAELSKALSTLCGYSLGILSKHVHGPYGLHRGTPSARCFFPVELYVGLEGDAGLGTGLYRYAPLYHGLERIRGAEALPVLHSAIGEPSAPAALTFLVSASLWRMCHLYGEFGYRLATIEAGMVAGQLLRLGETLGYSPDVHEWFRDGELASLTGVDLAEEGPMLVVRLRRPGQKSESTDYASSRAAVRELPPIHWMDQSGMRESCPRLVAIQEACAEEALTHRDLNNGEPAISDSPSAENEGYALPEPALPDCDLADLIRNRNSGFEWGGLNPLAVPMQLRSLSQVLYYSQGYADGLSTYVLAINVEGVPPGVYRYSRGAHTLVPAGGSFDMERDLPLLFLVPGVNVHNLGCVLFQTGDLSSFLDDQGVRGYRMLHMRAGAAAQEMSLLCAESDLFARPFLAVSAMEAARVLGLTRHGEELICSLLCGTNRMQALMGDLGLWDSEPI